MINITDAVNSTWIFTILLGIALFLSVRINKKRDFFPVSTTEELKGFAILAVVFSHIGYFLVNDQRFLFPLSTVAGVGVDIFLFLSGFGLTVSNLKKTLSPISFYLKRLPRIFIPFWIVLITFLMLDFFVLKISYPWQTTLKGFFGIFTRADIYKDIDSPFWYLTLILFYYLVYPLVFMEKRPWLSALLIYVATYLIVFQLNLDFFSQVRNLHSLHLLAFPAGIIFGWASLQKINIKSGVNAILAKYKLVNKKNNENIINILRIIAIGLFVALFYFTAVNSGVGSVEVMSAISMISTLSIFFIFILKRFDIKLLSLIGVYSYEIYLMHWPIMYRYDIFYKYIPAWLATSLYLILFMALAWVMQKLTDRILKRKPKVVK